MRIIRASPFRCDTPEGPSRHNNPLEIRTAAAEAARSIGHRPTRAGKFDQLSSRSVTFSARGRHAPLLMAALLATACGGRSPAPTSAGSPSAATSSSAEVQLLGFNDFHGALEPPSGGNGRIGTTEAGGVEFFATHMARLRATNPNTIVVSAGDNIGASTLLSGMFHDEPTIEALGEAGLQVSTVGNHEFDEGWAELYRMQHGGCHPVDGCQDRTPFAGARFEFLSANVMLDAARVAPEALRRSGWRPTAGGPQTLFPPFAIREIGGVRVGFIGLVLQRTADIVLREGLRGITFRREVDAGNDAVAAIVRQGVKTVVVLVHEGGTPATADPNGCGVTGPIVEITNGLSNDVDVIVAGHTHRAYICTMGTKLVTSAGSLGRLITDIDLTIDRYTGDVVRKAAQNVIVTRDVPKASGVSALLEHYRPFYTALGSKPVGTITTELTRAATPAGESALGDVVADAYLEGGRTVDPTVVAAFVNSGGIRNDLLGQPPPAPGLPRQVLYANVFDMLPFGNVIVVRTMTGEAILRWLEQQFDNPTSSHDEIMQVSAGLTYRYTRSRPVGQRIDRGSVTIGGRLLVPTERYRIVSSDFVWNGGDGFTVATEAMDPIAAGVDVDMFIRYLATHAPVAPGPQNRITRR
jgi:5'-nucleotidase